MLNKLILVFLVCCVAACVTVTEQEGRASFDHQKAAEARVKLGLSYLEAGNMPKARESLELALRYAPNYYRALNAIAYYYDRVGEIELANNAYLKALRVSPANGDVLNNYGTFLCQQGDFAKADEYFNRAIDLPHFYQVAASYENAAMCALSSEDTDKAYFYFKRAVEHEPHRYLSTLQLAKIEIDKYMYTEARNRLFKFHKRYGYKAASLGLLIELEKKSGNESLSSKYLDKLKSLYPESIEYQKYLANEY
jgi:type IV pilus assembly protein PilF